MGSGLCIISEGWVYLNSQYGEKKNKFLSLKDKVFRVQEEFNRQGDNGRSLHDVAKCKDGTAEECRVALWKVHRIAREIIGYITEDYRKWKVSIPV